MSHHRATPPDPALVEALRLAGCVDAQEEAAMLREAATSPAELASMLSLRLDGQPLEHVLGWSQFHGYRIAVAPGVFVPRRRSEFLVDQVLAMVETNPAGRPIKVLDLCCGSGAIGAAVAHGLARLAGLTGVPGLELHAADIDPAAVRCARINIAPFYGSTHCGDLFEPLPASLRGSIDVIVANAPYVPTSAIAFLPREARLYEPDTALNGGADGLAIHRRIAADAPNWLCPGGLIFLECSSRQAPASAALLTEQGLTSSILTADEPGSAVVVGQLALQIAGRTS